MSMKREHQIDEDRSQDIIILLDEMLPAAKRDVAATLDAEMAGVVSSSHSAIKRMRLTRWAPAFPGTCTPSTVATA